MSMLEIPATKREHTLKTARYLLDHDERDINEVVRVIRRCVHDDRYRYVKDLFLVRRDYAKILADIESGKKPRRKDEDKPKSAAKTSSTPAADSTPAVPEKPECLVREVRFGSPTSTTE